MNPERKLTSLGKELEIDTKTVKPFNPAKKHSDLIQKTEKLRETIQQIDKQQKTLNEDLKSMENKEDVKNYQKLEAMYANLGDKKKQEDFIKLKENIEKITEDYKALKQDTQNLKSDKQNLEQELRTKRKIGQNTQNLLEKLKKSEECINKEQVSIKTLDKVLQTVNEAINYPLQFGNGQKGHDKGELGPAKDSSHLNQSDHSQNIAQQLEGEFQHLKEIDALLKICERHRVPKTNDFSQLIKDEQTAFQQSIAKLNTSLMTNLMTPSDLTAYQGNHKILKQLGCIEQEGCSPITDKHVYSTKKDEILKMPQKIKVLEEEIGKNIESIAEKISEFNKSIGDDYEKRSWHFRDFLENSAYQKNLMIELEVYKQGKKSPEEFYDSLLKKVLASNSYKERENSLREHVASYSKRFNEYHEKINGHLNHEQEKICTSIIHKNPKNSDSDLLSRQIKNDEEYQQKCEYYKEEVKKTEEEAKKIGEDIKDTSFIIEKYTKNSGSSSMTEDIASKSTTSRQTSDGSDHSQLSYYQISKSLGNDIIKSIQENKKNCEDKAKLIIEYNTIFQELKKYEQGVHKLLSEPLQNTIKGQEQKLYLEVQADDKLIQSAQENLQGINTKIQSLEKRIQECKNKEKKITQEQSKREKDYQEMQKAYNKQRKNHINVLEPKVMPILEEMQRVRKEMEKCEQEKKNLQAELNKLEEAKQPVGEGSSDVGHLASGTNKHASKNKRGKGRYR